MAEATWLYRHPKRGQAHRATEDGAIWSPVKTACGRLLPEYERVRLERTDPADRCRRCVPPPGADERRSR